MPVGSGPLYHYYVDCYIHDVIDGFNYHESDDLHVGTIECYALAVNSPFERIGHFTPVCFDLSECKNITGTLVHTALGGGHTQQPSNSYTQNDLRDADAALSHASAAPNAIKDVLTDWDLFKHLKGIIILKMESIKFYVPSSLRILNFMIKKVI